jgi:hypothetical protein
MLCHFSLEMCNSEPDTVHSRPCYQECANYYHYYYHY